MLVVKIAFVVLFCSLAMAAGLELLSWVNRRRTKRKAIQVEDKRIDDIFTRVDKEGIYTEDTDLGRVFIFTADKLKILWEEAENNPTKKLMILVRMAPIEGYV